MLSVLKLYISTSEHATGFSVEITAYVRTYVRMYVLYAQDNTVLPNLTVVGNGLLTCQQNKLISNKLIVLPLIGPTEKVYSYVCTYQGIFQEIKFLFVFPEHENIFIFPRPMEMDIDYILMIIQSSFQS